VRAVNSAHSSLVSILAEQGGVGFLPWLGVVFVVWRLLLDVRRQAGSAEDLLLVAAVRGACLAYLAMSLTLTMWPYGTSNNFLAILLGAAAAQACEVHRGAPDER